MSKKRAEKESHFPIHCKTQSSHIQQWDCSLCFLNLWLLPSTRMLISAYILVLFYMQFIMSYISPLNHPHFVSLIGFVSNKLTNTVNYLIVLCQIFIFPVILTTTLILPLSLCMEITESDWSFGNHHSLPTICLRSSRKWCL